ncbi:MAG TPA: GNAT family N-acetyltransferase, partial [Kiloniellaceae bacterium]|nr:GNAT family N-acetyltransferase [Kiloniellaceae bacterium]
MSAQTTLAIRPAGAGDMDRVRAIFREYADWLQVDYCLKDF